LQNLSELCPEVKYENIPDKRKQTKTPPFPAIAPIINRPSETKRTEQKRAWKHAKTLGGTFRRL